MCAAAEGLNASEFMCVASGQTGAQCQANGNRVRSTAGGCVMMCAEDDGLRNSHTCVTTVADADECTANGALLNGTGGMTCISRDNCTDMTADNQYINLGKDTCVSACAAGEGVNTDDECVASPNGDQCDSLSMVLGVDGMCTASCGAGQNLDSSTHTCRPALMCEDGEGISADATPVCVSNGQTGADCNRAGMVLATSGSCAAACDGAEGFIAGEYKCTTMNLTGALCHANENRVYNVGTMACETVMTCTVRTGGSDYRFISNMQCVNSCPADEGVNASGECTSTALTGQFCLNALRVLRGGVCDSSGCAVSEGLRGGVCITSDLMEEDCVAIEVLLRGNVCIEECVETDGLRGDTCIATGASGPECEANSAFKTWQWCLCYHV